MQDGDGRTQVRPRVVAEAVDARVPFERLLHDPPLDTSAPAVHQAYFPEACGMRFVDVFLHHGRNVSREEGVEIELRLDRYADRIIFA
jgi:hypothetical protein